MDKRNSYALDLQKKSWINVTYVPSLGLRQIFIVFILSVCISQTLPPLNPEKFDRGLELYLTQGCGVCHTLSKANSKGIFGPSHDGLFAVAQARFQSPDYQGKASSAEDYIRESILEPNAFIVPGYALTRFHMPAYINLAPDDLDALVYMLLQP